MPVAIHGKEYLTVAERVHTFRQEHADWAIITELVSEDETKVIMKASIKPASALNDAPTIATGYAEEVRGSTNINKTSAMENCETSAIGRALSALGLSGTEYASADEVANAIKQQLDKEHIEYMAIVRDEWSTIAVVKRAIKDEEYSVAVEAISELDDETKKSLWKAPTKGGIWTTEERTIMHSNEWHAAREAYHGR